jgi:hypothetical protein
LITAEETASLSGDARALELRALIRRFAQGLPGTRFRAQKAQISLDCAHPYAAVWHPATVLHRPAAPLVLTLFSRRTLHGPWKEVAAPRPDRLSHHAELFTPTDFTPALQEALRQAHAEAQ